MDSAGLNCPFNLMHAYFQFVERKSEIKINKIAWAKTKETKVEK